MNQGAISETEIVDLFRIQRQIVIQPNLVESSASASLLHCLPQRSLEFCLPFSTSSSSYFSSSGVFALP
jgi:hypothetical protein